MHFDMSLVENLRLGQTYIYQVCDIKSKVMLYHSNTYATQPDNFGESQTALIIKPEFALSKKLT